VALKKDTNMQVRDGMCAEVLPLENPVFLLQDIPGGLSRHTPFGSFMDDEHFCFLRLRLGWARRGTKKTAAQEHTP
jgi:hypothetical protein